MEQTTGRREYPAVIRNTRTHPDTIVYSAEKDLKWLSIFDTKKEKQHMLKLEKYNDLVRK